MDNGDIEISPFSIHNIARVGQHIGRKPGDWYGPQAISIVLKRLNKSFWPFPNFEMIVCKEGNIYLDRIEKKFTSKHSSVFVVVPVRLGLHYIPPEYLESVKEVFNFTSNVGICGG